MIRLSFWLLSLVTFCTLASSEDAVLVLKDDRFEQTLDFNVALPKSYQNNPEKRYILLFDFHHYAHTYLTGLHDWMSHNGEWPWLETIIVTPKMGNPVGKLFDATGNTTPLLDFFETQLIPAIDASYRTNGFRIITGFRYNGSVVLSSLLNKPELFNAHIAISPELKDDVAAIMSSSATKLQKLTDKPHFLMLAYAQSVKEDHQFQEYQKLNTIIDTNLPRNMEYHFVNFKNHYHMSMSPLATIYGIEALFEDVHRGLPADSEISQAGIAAIVKHYQWLTEQKYGFTVSAKRSIRNLGEYQLEHAPEQAISTFVSLVQHYPEDPYSYHYLADAYATSGDLENAIKQQHKAVELSASSATWHQKRMQRFLQQYQSAKDQLKN